MSGKIDIRIEFEEIEGVTDEREFERGQWLDGLQAELRRELEIDCDSEKIPSPDNTQDGGLTTAIAVAGLTLALVNTLLTVIKFHNERQKRFSISVRFGNKHSFTKTNLTEKEIKQFMKDMQRLNIDDIEIHLTDGK